MQKKKLVSNHRYFVNRCIDIARAIRVDEIVTRRACILVGEEMKILENDQAHVKPTRTPVASLFFLLSTFSSTHSIRWKNDNSYRKC